MISRWPAEPTHQPSAPDHTTSPSRGVVEIELYKSYDWDMSPSPDEPTDSVHILPVSEARDQLPELLNRAAYTGQVTYITKRGQRVGAIVPVEVAEAAEQAEDEYLSRLASEAEAELAAGGTTRPLEEVLTELGLTHGGSVAPAPREGDPPAVSPVGNVERRPHP